MSHDEAFAVAPCGGEGGVHFRYFWGGGLQTKCMGYPEHKTSDIVGEFGARS